MNDTMLSRLPEVGGYVDVVRLYLGDLPDDVREELTGGLEADLGELVSDRGIEVLPDPEVYADELRTAAGLPARVVRRPPRRGSWREVGAAGERRLDRLHDAWETTMSGPGLRPTWELGQDLRPLWWVVRAWVAVQIGALVYYDDNGFDLGFPTSAALIAFGFAALLSVQVGRTRLWPGRGGLSARLVLLASNATAAVLLPFVVEQLR